MTTHAEIKEQANALFKSARYLHEISTDAEYRDALAFIEELMDEDNDENDGLIDLLSSTIERWENEAPEFDDFNRKVAGLDETDVLRLLMEQHDLGVADLPEIGQKSLVSRILNGERNLTKAHIQALSDRFGISPALFFSNSGRNEREAA